VGLLQYEIGVVFRHLNQTVTVKHSAFHNGHLFLGNYQDAENILLSAGLIFRAILLNIYLHQWEKALDLAVKHKTHVDTVLAYRIKHLNRFDKEENIKKYTEYMKEVDIDWEKIASKVESEFQKESERGRHNK